jgi:hypothetical protein
MNKKEKSGISKVNIYILIVAIITLTIAYSVMATGDITVSPILLVITYTIVIPLALLYPVKKK